MLGNLDYRRTYGLLSLVLGLVGIVALAFLIGLGRDLLAVFAFIFGWKVYRLSRIA